MLPTPPPSPWTPDIAAPTDYSPTIGVDIRLESAGLVDRAGAGMLPKNGQPTLADVTDGLSYTIMYAVSGALVDRLGVRLAGADEALFRRQQAIEAIKEGRVKPEEED